MRNPKQRTFANSHTAVSVKTGFSWPALLLGSLWAAAKGMWFPYFFVLLAVDIGIWAVAGYAEAIGSEGLALLALLATLAYAVVRGWLGNRWLMASLRSRGYRESA